MCHNRREITLRLFFDVMQMAVLLSVPPHANPTCIQTIGRGIKRDTTVDRGCPESKVHGTVSCAQSSPYLVKGDAYLAEPSFTRSRLGGLRDLPLRVSN